MPTVIVEPVGWVSQKADATVFGRADFIKTGDYFETVVRLPLPTLIVAEKKLLRRILVHEFAHCFWFVVKALEGPVDFTPPEGVDAFDFGHATDDEYLINPLGWFGMRDVMRFQLTHQELDPATARYKSDWIDRGLPIEVPGIHLKIDGTVGIPDDIMSRIKKLYPNLLRHRGS
jgi:hypothetical protein